MTGLAWNGDLLRLFQALTSNYPSLGFLSRSVGLSHPGIDIQGENPKFPAQ